MKETKQTCDPSSSMKRMWMIWERWVDEFLHDSKCNKVQYDHKEEGFYYKVGAIVGGACVGSSQSDQSYSREASLPRRLRSSCFFFLFTLPLHTWSWRCQHVGGRAELALLLCSGLCRRREAARGRAEDGSPAQTLHLSQKVQVWRHAAGAPRRDLWERDHILLQVLVKDLLKKKTRLVDVMMQVMARGFLCAHILIWNLRNATQPGWSNCFKV